MLFCAPATAKAQVARAIAQKAFPSVVLLTMESANGEGGYLGSGFFVREGIVATNFHVVKGSSKGFARVLGLKDEYPIAGIVGIDRERDLVLLSVPGAKAPSLPLGDSSQVAVGDEVYVVGNPKGLEGTFSEGIVSAVRQVGSNTLIQVTAPISPGSSGGPVLNSQGKVIGIAVATIKGGQNLNFAVPSLYLSPMLAELKPLRPLFAEAGPTQSPRVRRGRQRAEATPSQAQSNVESHLQRCGQLMEAGKYREAELECCAAAKLDPENANLQAKSSFAMLVDPIKLDEAINAAREAARLSPNDETAHLYLGLALQTKGNPVSTLMDQAWRDELKEPGKQESSEEMAAKADANSKRELSEAILEFREALRLNPSDDVAHYDLGETLEMAGNPDAGIAEYREALRLNPNSVPARVGLASALGGHKHDLDGAVAEMRAAVQLDPDNPWHHQQLAEWLERKGDRKGALEEYNTAIALDPQNSMLRGYYETFLQKMNAADEQDKLQHWLGTWVFAGPVKHFLSLCNGKYVHSTGIPNYSFKVLTINGSGEVAAQVGVRLTAESIRNPKPDWSGTATDTSLVLTMDPIPPGTDVKLKEAAGRLEVRREGDRYSVDFISYSKSSSEPDCGNSEVSMRFLGEMRRP
jgi:tetratricopeptide (TPR) repeat protein